jgi:hypothetical protein
VGEERDVGAFFDDGHAEGAEVADLPLGEEGGAGAEDGAVEVLGEGKGVLEGFDAAGVALDFYVPLFLPA